MKDSSYGRYIVLQSSTADICFATLLPSMLHPCEEPGLVSKVHSCKASFKAPWVALVDCHLVCKQAMRFGVLCIDFPFYLLHGLLQRHGQGSVEVSQTPLHCSTPNLATSTIQ